MRYPSRMAAPEPAMSSKPASHREDALGIVRALRAAGHTAYFAGGCVRDLLLGREPKDYDVATDAHPAKVRSLFGNTQAVGQAFGVILVRTGRSVIEVATFRGEGQYLDGRHPTEVRFTTAEEDAKRRDFTINGLFLDPIDNRVLDFVGGQDDLRQGVLRAIGTPAARFQEDHLRLMRAVRFASRLGFTIDPATAAAIRTHAAQLARISAERIGEEMRLMLTPASRVVAWRYLRELELLPVVLRFLSAPPVEGEAHQGGSAELFPLVAPGDPISFGLALAALTLGHQLSRAGRANWEVMLSGGTIRSMVQACRRGMKISNEDSDVMTGALDLLPLLRPAVPTVATLKRLIARPVSTDARRLLDALPHMDPALTRVAWLREQFAELEQMDCAPPPLVTGDDLVAAELTPGPTFKRVLDTVYDAQLEGHVKSKVDAMKMALQLARAM